MLSPTDASALVSGTGGFDERLAWLLWVSMSAVLVLMAGWVIRAQRSHRA